jgi:hypothetical protein
MFRRLACLLALAPALGGCLLTVSPPIGDNESELAQLRAENKGMILIHTSLADGRCLQVLAKITQPDAAGRYLDGKEIYLRKPPIKGPSEIVLPAGDYGIVQLNCYNFSNGSQYKYYNARVASPGNIVTGEGTIYEQPIAKFSVQPGEFVDVGSLNVETLRVGNPYGQQGEFAVSVTPIEENWIRSLASAKPKIHALRVQRLMTIPGQAQQPSASQPAPRNPGRGQPIASPPRVPSGKAG